MKGILLPYGASILIIGFVMLVAGSNKSDDILLECGIDKDTTLQMCLTPHLQHIRFLETIAGTSKDAVRQHIFRESLNCFPEKSREKICYLRRFPYNFTRDYESTRGSAIALYYAFMMNTMQLLMQCNMNKTNSPSLFECIKDIDPSARNIINRTDYSERQAFIKMAMLISKIKACYSKISEDQRDCIVNKNLRLQWGSVDQLQWDQDELIKTLENCSIPQNIINRVTDCTTPNGLEMVYLSFGMFGDTARAEKVWSLIQKMSSCKKAYRVVRDCLESRNHSRPSPRRPERLSVNPFHFEDVTGILLRYIASKSKSMIKECRLDSRKLPDVFLCMKKRYDENKDVKSTDPKKRFIAFMELMNTTAKCFNKVNESQKRCLFKNKQEMVETVNDNAKYLGQIMKQILQACNATVEITICVKVHHVRLEYLAKTLLTNPEIAKTVWHVGTSLGECLDNHPAIRKCVLDRNMTSPKEKRKPW